MAFLNIKQKKETRFFVFSMRLFSIIDICTVHSVGLGECKRFKFL